MTMKIKFYNVVSIDDNNNHDVGDDYDDIDGDNGANKNCNDDNDDDLHLLLCLSYTIIT